MSEKLEKLWINLCDRFKGNPLDLNFKQVVLTYLNEKRSDYLTHYIHSYPAKMFAYIPTFFFSISDLCPPNGIVLDPFCGSGTAPLESLINPLHKRNIFAVELNPLGRLITKVKTTPLKNEELEIRIKALLELATKSHNFKVCLPESKKLISGFQGEQSINLLTSSM
ncbi:MAG: hypothetical protein IBV52_05705 [Candidatus Bathyarchaeota archaeon]